MTEAEKPELSEEWQNTDYPTNGDVFVLEDSDTLYQWDFSVQAFVQRRPYHIFSEPSSLNASRPRWRRAELGPIWGGLPPMKPACPRFASKDDAYAALKGYEQLIAGFGFAASDSHQRHAVTKLITLCQGYIAALDSIEGKGCEE